MTDDMNQHTRNSARTKPRFGGRLASPPTPKSQPWLIPWENPIAQKDRYEAIRKIDGLTRADKDVLRQLVTYSLNRCHGWIHFEALTRDANVLLRKAKASLKKLRSLYIVLTWTAQGERTLIFEIVWWIVGRRSGREFPKFACPHRPAMLEIPLNAGLRSNGPNAKRQAPRTPQRDSQLLLPFSTPPRGRADTLWHSADVEPKPLPPRADFSAEFAPKTGTAASQAQCRNCTEIGAGTAPAIKEEDAEQKAAEGTAAAADLVRRMLKLRPTFSPTQARRLVEQHTDSFRAVLAQLEDADNREIYEDKLINWCVSHDELLSVATRVSTRETADATRWLPAAEWEDPR